MQRALLNRRLARTGVVPATARAFGAAKPRMVAINVQRDPEIRDVEARVEKAVNQANDICDRGDDEACTVAWEGVHELEESARQRKRELGVPGTDDPVEEYCASESNQDEPECRVHDV